MSAYLVPFLSTVLGLGAIWLCEWLHRADEREVLGD